MPGFVGLRALGDLVKDLPRDALDRWGAPAIVGQRRGPAPDFEEQAGEGH